ncbi:MAG: glycoside hydrolase family 2 [Clostridiales bacterium]|nr:glycoside hydrolase family 2 [Clostridiales bacterium]
MPCIPKPEFPRPEKRRESWLNLNGNWQFELFAEGNEEAEKQFSKNRNSYSRVIRVPFSWVSPLSEVEENVAGIGWYRREVEYAKKGRVFLCFGAVDYKTDVYVNGSLAGHHQGGYSYFEVEATALWREGKNTVEVRAEDYRRETQLYGKQGYGEIQGIWQTVWLEDRPQSYIRDFRITTRICGDVMLDICADAPDGDTISACFEGHCASAKVEKGKANILLHIDNPHLWCPGDPYLYEGKLQLGDDQVFTYFGVREISCEKVDGRGYKWILLNGKPIYLQGTLDQAFHPQGHFTYPTDDDMYQEAFRLKRLGLNMVRIHIKPEEPRKLYWMDKLGILVMADIPCFWGPPILEAKEAYENEMPEIMQRDLNHPAIFAWVVFNESWGLLDKEKEEKVYRKETQEWVRSMYHKAKAIDPERIVEDNSPCRYDHVETDLNTWHFYLNTYPVVRDHIRKIVENTYPGSEFNYIGGNKQTDAPLMNSECGMVWGVENSAGDSDLAWQYHYMLNEYRLHEKICGFVFTEFHDVVNEFNGYYRIDNSDKDFGYQDLCRGMTIRDLHADDFVATDCPPMQSVNAGTKVKIPLVLSSFSDRHHQENCKIAWELWHDGLRGRVTDDSGEMALPPFGYGATALGDLEVIMPTENAAPVLSLYLMDSQDSVISRNFVAFDVQAKLPENMIEVPVCQGKASGFEPVWKALVDDKLCLGGAGEVSYDIALPGGLIRDITLHMEAGAKRVLKKDCKEVGAAEPDLGFMRGYLVDRGAFENSYWMTDESRFPSDVEVLVNGEVIREMHLENDWADARGMLSWHRQPQERHLDEAGSYGEQQHIPIPSRLLSGIARDGRFTLTFRVKAKGGLALYGRNCGRYPFGLLVEVN